MVASFEMATKKVTASPSGGVTRSMCYILCTYIKRLTMIDKGNGSVDRPKAILVVLARLSGVGLNKSRDD